MGVRIVLADNEPLALALRRFKRALELSGVHQEMRKRGLLVQPQGCHFRANQARRAKQFRKRFRSRQATLWAKLAGELPTDRSRSELMAEFWQRTGKP